MSECSWRTRDLGSRLAGASPYCNGEVWRLPATMGERAESANFPFGAQCPLRQPILCELLAKAAPARSLAATKKLKWKSWLKTAQRPAEAHSLRRPVKYTNFQPGFQNI